MNIEMWAGVVAIVLVPTAVLLGARAVAHRASAVAGSEIAGRSRRTLDAGMAEFGPILPAVVAVLAGVSATIGIMWVLGKGAHKIQGGVDWPVWRWLGHHQNVEWTNAWWHITNMGSPLVTQRLVVIGGIILAIICRNRLWWLPPAVLAVAYVFEKCGQIILKLVVDRGHPPHAAMKFGDVAATLGTWPSGGCARVLVIYGLLTYFAVRVYHGGRSQQAWVLGATFVSLALTMQAYARLNNIEHWFTDVVGGIIFGALLLSTMVAGSEIVQRGMSRRRAANELAGSMPSLARPERTRLPTMLRTARALIFLAAALCAVEFVARGTWTAGTGRWKGWALAVLVAAFTYLAVKITGMSNQRPRPTRTHRRSEREEGAPLAAEGADFAAS